MEFKSRFISVDTETGGLSSKKNPIVEISMFAFDINLDNTGDYTSLIRPYDDSLVIEQQALNANGLTIDKIESGKESFIVVKEIIQFLKSQKEGKNLPILIGHNIIKFDMNFIEDFFKFHDQDIYEYINHDFMIDTMWWSRLCWKESANYKLGTVCQNAGIDLVNAHRAESDTVATRDLAKFLISNLRGEGKSSCEKSEVRYREVFQF
jgi:DNA polymerase III alpha subunit (gram-positive type)